MYRDLTGTLKGIASAWQKKLQAQARQDISAGDIINPPEIPETFTQKLTEKLREALAQGYWLNHLYVQELKAAYEGRKYRGKVRLSDLSEDERIMELLRDFMELETSNEWYEIIPIEAVNWLNEYVPKLAGALSTDVLEKTRDVIRNSMLEGSTLQERMKALRESSEEISRMADQRIEAIARTEITRADSMGRLISMKSNDDVIGVEFSAVMDDRTTEMCVERNGLIMRLDDPRLPENTPPIHVCCRSLLLSLTVYDFPDGVLTSHEFDEVPSGTQRPEDIEEVRLLLVAEREEEKLEPQSVVTIPNAKTIAEANTIAVQYGLAREADFGKLHISVANEMIEQLRVRRDMFPDLPELDFVGSMQAQQRFRLRVIKDEYFEANKEALRRTYPRYTDEQIKEKMLSVKKHSTKNAYGGAYNGKGEAGCSYSIRSVGLNETFFSRKGISEGIHDRLRFEEEIHWRPQGTGSVKGVMTHELGHTIDNSLGISSDRQICELFAEYNKNYRATENQSDGTWHYISPMAKELSEYGNTNINEFIAEAWSEYMTSLAPRPIAKKVSERIIELYQEAVK